MPGIGTAVNVVTVLLGGGVGLLLKRGMSQRFQQIIFTGVGAGVFLIGLTGAMATSLTAAQTGALSSRWGLCLVLSLVLGGVVGEALGIDAAFERLGAFLRQKTAGPAGQVGAVEGFVSATVIFCVGSMAIIGAMEDAAGSPNLLLTKAMLDGVTAAVLATAYGVGVLFSAFSILIYQGALTLLAIWIMPVIPEALVGQMSLVGSAIIMLIGLSLWEIKRFNISNLTPAVFMPALLWMIPFLH